jgi:NADPH-dependent 2,4-dienoyl-CoA reductase/sulfur reductase-like enzyme
VILIDESPWLGGQIWRGQQRRPSGHEAQTWFDRFQRSGAKLLSHCAVIASPQPGLLLAEREGSPCQIKWHRLILTTGARELFLPFPGWTCPGIVGPGGLQALIKNGWPVSGKRVVVAGSGPLLLVVAETLRKNGARVLAIVEQAPWERIMQFGLGLAAHPGKLFQGLGLKLRLLGIPYQCGSWPVRAEGKEQLQSVTVTDGKKTRTVACDLLACGFGLEPNIELPLALGCELKNGFVLVNELQGTSVRNVFCAGEPTGIGGADCALVEGQIAGYAASDNNAMAQSLFLRRSAWHKFRTSLAEAFALRPELRSLTSVQTIFCRCEDVTFGTLRRFAGWREAKLHSRCGMGACQGRVCGAAAKFVLGWGMESVRPPVLPARVGSLVSNI